MTETETPIITSVWSCFGHRFMSDDNGQDEWGNTTESCLTCGAMFKLAPRADDPTSGDYRAANGDDPMPCTHDTGMVHAYSGEGFCHEHPDEPCGHTEHDCNCLFCA